MNMYLNLNNNLSTNKFIRLDPGEFEMGYQESDPRYEHYISRKAFKAQIVDGYWLAQYPLRVKEWNSLVDTKYQRDYNGEEFVKDISWHEAMMYCSLLNRKYKHQIPPGYLFSLPTEMQWEYACRAGANSYFYEGATVKPERREKAGLVGHKDFLILEPNIWGFYDMYNVNQWCFDYIECILFPGADYYNNINTSKTFKGQSSPYKSYQTHESKPCGIRLCIRKKIEGLQSPQIINSKWGLIKTEEFQEYKDVKCFPCGSRPWDWEETGTKHSPGIQIDDVQELLDLGATTIVLSQGYHSMLQVPQATREFLLQKNIPTYILETSKAIKIYNKLAADKVSVGGLFHSTC